MAESNFIDYVRIHCVSGHGGAGSTHLHRAKYVPKGGPDVATEAAEATSSSRRIRSSGP